jgi:(2Fe-2S) ferredoxin
MDHSDCQQPLEFNFEGEFLGFVDRLGKSKYLRLKMLSEEVQIKIPKSLRLSIGLALHPGATIAVAGMGKFNPAEQELKLKATQVKPLDPHQQSMDVTTPIAAPHPAKPKIKLLVCQKKGCLKKGGKGLCETLKQTLCAHNIDQHVIIQSTGCLKRCGAAPNLLMMPGNHHYTEVGSKTVKQIVDRINQKV